MYTKKMFVQTWGNDGQFLTKQKPEAIGLNNGDKKDLMPIKVAARSKA
jgi:hypothetical protein